jgi:plastocyanin
MSDHIDRIQARPVLGLIGALIVVVATACDGPATAAMQPNSQPLSSAVSMTENPYRFQPVMLNVPAGTAVTWTNTGSEPHTVTADPSKAANRADASLPAGVEPWDSGLLTGGQSYSHTFTVAGTYKYFCIPHEALGMVATITVT